MWSEWMTMNLYMGIGKWWVHKLTVWLVICSDLSILSQQVGVFCKTAGISSLSVHFLFYLCKNTNLLLPTTQTKILSASFICTCSHSGVSFALYGEGGRKHALHVILMSDHGMYLTMTTSPIVICLYMGMHSRQFYAMSANFFMWCSCCVYIGFHSETCLLFLRSARYSHCHLSCKYKL
jgi:hypothetical protein